MAKDYNKIAETALKLIKESGRQVTFLKFDDTPDNAAKPWAKNTDLRTGSASVSTKLFAISVHPTDINVLGIRIRNEDLMSNLREILIVAPGKDFQGDLAEYQELDDGTHRFRISFMERLKPANTTVLWYAGVTE